MKRTGKIFTLLSIVIIISLPVLLQAQTGFNDDTLDNPVPFDGGVSLLLAAAIGYGLKKANDKRKADKL